MNAVTKTETRTVTTLEVADPPKNLILVPLSRLLARRSKRNVRTTPRLFIPELAASISRIGLLQNLIVIAAADGEQYEVVAGDRRLAEDTGWMPAVFQTGHHTEPEGVPDAASDVNAPEDAADEMEAHTMAA